MCEYRGGKPPCVMKVKALIRELRWDPRGAPSTDHDPSGERFECEHTCWDPKDGELCLSRVKPGETLVEARSDCDVQIHREIWV
jgi:hypothetical protein